MTTRLRSPLRFLAAAALVVVAVVHARLAPEHLTEARYVGVLFVLLAVVGVLLAGAVVAWDCPAVWVVAGTVTAGAVVAFLASRTVGLPEMVDDVGNWSEVLAYPALVAEVLTSSLAVSVVRRSGRSA